MQVYSHMYMYIQMYLAFKDFSSHHLQYLSLTWKDLGDLVAALHTLSSLGLVELVTFAI